MQETMTEYAAGVCYGLLGGCIPEPYDPDSLFGGGFDAGKARRAECSVQYRSDLIDLPHLARREACAIAEHHFSEATGRGLYGLLDPKALTRWAGCC